MATLDTRIVLKIDRGNGTMYRILAGDFRQLVQTWYPGDSGELLYRDVMVNGQQFATPGFVYLADGDAVGNPAKTTC